MCLLVSVRRVSAELASSSRRVHISTGYVEKDGSMFGCKMIVNGRCTTGNGQGPGITVHSQ